MTSDQIAAMVIARTRPESDQRRLSRGCSVTVKPLSAETLDQVASWFADPTLYKWLDFGGGKQKLSGKTLHYMSRSADHFIRVLHDDRDRAGGIFGLQNISSPFKTAMLWGVRPRLRPPSRSNATAEIREILRVGFVEFGLNSVYAWVVEQNGLSIASLKRAGFKEMGRQRKAHIVDGVACDRLLFDILAEEFFEADTEFQQSSESA